MARVALNVRLEAATERAAERDVPARTCCRRKVDGNGRARLQHGTAIVRPEEVMERAQGAVSAPWATSVCIVFKCCEAQTQMRSACRSVGR